LRRFDIDKLINVVIVIIMVLIVFVMIYPLYFVIIASVSEPVSVVAGDVVLWPKGFSFNSYLAVFSEESIWIGYRNSIFYTLFGTLFAMVLTIPASYVLSKKNLRFRGIITTYFIINMFFGGGLLPTYLVVKNLHLLNKPWTLVILGAFSIYNMIVARTFFQTSIPESLYEAAEIDGCSSEFGKFIRIALPLSKPILAVIALYYAVGKWNDYYTGLVYTTNPDLYPLQLVLRTILLENANRLANIDPSLLSGEELMYLSKQAYLAEAMKYSIIFIASFPMLVAYPFVQKHFVKGVMIGSVKG
jgi:putative aldouronate transport system permease protein